MKSFRMIGLPFVTVATMALLAGCGGTSTVTGPLTDTAPPAAPANVILTHDDLGRMAIVWDASSSAVVKTYEVYLYSPSPDRASAYVLMDDPNPSDTVFVLPAGTAESNEVFRVVAVTSAGAKSALSAPVTVVGNPSGGGGPGVFETQ